MKIKVTQEKLSKALNNVSRIAIGKVTLPILNNVLIKVDKKKVIIDEMDVIMLLRVQFERHNEAMQLSVEDYHKQYGLSLDKVGKMKEKKYSETDVF